MPDAGGDGFDEEHANMTMRATSNPAQAATARRWQILITCAEYPTYVRAAWVAFRRTVIMTSTPNRSSVPKKYGELAS